MFYGSDYVENLSFIVTLTGFGDSVWYSFRCAALSVLSIFAIILIRKRELVALP